MVTIEVKTREDIKFNIQSEVKFTKDDKYVEIYSCGGDKKYYLVTYWVIGKEGAVQLASNCSSERGVISKVAKFLNL